MVLPLSFGAKGKKTSDGLLSSEDLKEEKTITTSSLIITVKQKFQGPCDPN
jgi:hypothetical protein